MLSGDAIRACLFDLLREKSPVCFRYCELEGALEGCLRRSSLFKPTPHGTSGCVHEMIGVKFGCDGVERSQRSGRTIHLADGDGSIEGNYGVGMSEKRWS
jgi:hypothetical protein